MPATVPGVYLTRPCRVLGGSPGDKPTGAVDEESELIPVLVIGGTVPVAGMDLDAWPIGGTLVSSGGRPCSTATIRVKGCGNGNFPGAWVEVSSDGTVIAEGYSTSSPGNGGVLTFTAPGPGEYTARAKHYRYSDQPSTTFEITQCGSIPSSTLQFTTPKSGFTCTATQSAIAVLGGWPLPDELVGYRYDSGNLVVANWVFRKQAGESIWLADTDGGLSVAPPGYIPAYLVFRGDITTGSGILYTDPLTPPGLGTGYGLQEWRTNSSTSDPIVPTASMIPGFLENGFTGTSSIQGSPLQADMPHMQLVMPGFPVRDEVTGDSADEPWLDD